MSPVGFGKDFSRGFKLLADEAEAKGKSASRISDFRAVAVWRLPRDFLCHLRKGEAKLNVTLKLPGVDAAFAFRRGVIELEEAELDRAFGEGCVEVKHCVASVVVVCVPAAVGVLVPNVRERRHRVGLPLVQPFEEGGVDRPAVAVHSVAVEFQGLGEEAFVACHKVRQVAERFGCVAVCADVAMNTAPVFGVAYRACVAKSAGNFL